ncbi:type II toxin-antitoxin system RelE/ParE family toxin [Flavobacterium silvaticum]|uniref:Toxin n=1 Tax=Flavobacterium silvaticum TaxID=1852020 RepID=A0A972FIB3_9FLAO|nr:type II toxin-antitoxin system RelE/ParE family toxin [Flavobacterium silvaticum]NMH26514.1 type II toxin-antitoxin system RelE/ParE family toxin [Flavobacterium silvaticum]
MAKYILTNKAVLDLSDIWDYTCDEWSEDQADKYYDLLLASCQELAKHPNFGKNYENINKNLLGFKSNHHIIFFRIISDKEIEIARILHEKMDLKSKL